MATPDTQKLLLKSVNILLRSIGELGISDEEDFNALVEANEAKETIQEVLDAVLSEGWDFNSSDGAKLVPQPDGIIPIPYNVLEVSSIDGDLIMKDWRLYSKSANSIVFESTQTVDIIWNVPFDSLTHALRHYITIRAALVFGARLIGDSAAFKYTSVDEDKAFYSAKHSDSRTGKYNMLNGAFGQTVNSRGL